LRRWLPDLAYKHSETTHEIDVVRESTR
jgi:hypothetical protein